MSGRVLHASSYGDPTLRVRNEAEMAAGIGWTADVLTFPPSPSAADWGWGAARRAPEAPIGKRLLRRGGALVRSRNLRFDVRFAYFGALVDELENGRYDVLHWRDLAVAVGAGRVARRVGCRFVLDLHENYPYNMWSTERDLGVRDRRYDLNEWFRYERLAVEEADVVLVTIDEMGQRLVGMHGTSPDKIRVLPNTELAERWSSFEASPELAERYSGRAIALYAGSCSPHRGLDTIIEALPLVEREWPELTVVIIGDGPGIPAWREQAKRLGVSSRVVFEGPKPFAEVREYHDLAVLGLVPHHKYGQTDNTAPHKLAQNMISGLPTLVSSCHCLQRLAHDTGAALVFEAGHPASAAERLLELRDPGVRERLARAGHEAVGRPPHSWESARAVLERAYAG